MIPSLNVSVGLTVIGPVGARLTAASEISRRAAAVSTHDVGGSRGAAGALRLAEFSISSTTMARTVKTLGGSGALGVVGLIATRAFGATGVLTEANAFDRVVTAGEVASLGFDEEASVERVFAETSSATPVLPEDASLAADPIAATFESGCEFADADDDGRDRRVLCGDA